MTDFEIEEFIHIAYEAALEALKYDEVPIGSIIVNEAKVVVGTGFNQTEKLKDPTAHAEILAIKSAAEKINDWRLDNHIIFSTIEPCEMCMGAIIESRIKEVYFGAKNNKRKNEEKKIKSTMIKNPDCQNLIKEFFKNLR
ncbi:MAG: nucleoside deaminase [Thermodesulfobacteriota bacterium]|nr:nucleoside deaminase [Thermodesulfobacteriota bacterium]